MSICSFVFFKLCWPHTTICLFIGDRPNRQKQSESSGGGDARGLPPGAAGSDDATGERSEAASQRDSRSTTRESSLVPASRSWLRQSGCLSQAIRVGLLLKS